MDFPHAVSYEPENRLWRDAPDASHDGADATIKVTDINPHSKDFNQCSMYATMSKSTYKVSGIMWIDVASSFVQAYYTHESVCRQTLLMQTLSCVRQASE